jgi:hypothetical protein
MKRWKSYSEMRAPQPKLTWKKIVNPADMDWGLKYTKIAATCLRVVDF